MVLWGPHPLFPLTDNDQAGREVSVFILATCPTVGWEATCNAGATGDVSLILRWGRSPGGGNGNPLQYSCLENPLERGAWWAIVHGVTKSWTLLSNNHSLNIHLWRKLPCLEIRRLGFWSWLYCLNWPRSLPEFSLTLGMSVNQISYGNQGLELQGHPQF